jgi:hypothetical protein
MGIILDEPFTVNKLGEVTFDQGTKEAGMTVEGGVLKFTDANDHSFHVGREAIDALHTVKVTRGSGEYRPTIYILLKWVDENNFMFVQMDEGFLDFYCKREGEYHQLNRRVGTEFSMGTPEWFWANVTGNVIKYGISTVDPHIEAPKGIENEVTLAGGDATAFGEGKAGEIGLRLASYTAGFHSNATVLDDWIVEGPTRQLTGSMAGTAHFSGVLAPRLTGVMAAIAHFTGTLHIGGTAVNQTTMVI